jgi:predicted nucleotidyltransferase
MSTTPSHTPQATVSEAQLQKMAVEILQEIPGAEVWLFGSHARGQGRPDSDVDLLLYSQSQVEQRRQLRCNVVSQAYEHGVRLHG